MKYERDTIINGGTYKLTGNSWSNNWKVKNELQCVHKVRINRSYYKRRNK